MKALKLPFTKTHKAEFKNDASALNNKVFVDSAIKEFIASKPLSVSTNSSGKKGGGGGGGVDF